ncbi:7995_t:CDS:2, partial [Dentiscutata heterogama]
MLKLKPYIEILASSFTVQQEKDAIMDRKCLKAIIITEDEWSIVANIIKILKPFNNITNYISGNEDINDDFTNKQIDLNTSSTSLFDKEKVSDEDEEDTEQFKSLAITIDLVESIKKIIAKLFLKYYKFFDDEILLIAIAIDPSDKNLKLLSNKAILDLSGLFISTVFTAVQKNLIHKNKVNQYLMMEMIGPLENLLQCHFRPCEYLFSQCKNVMTKKRTWLTPQIF